jgi:hypothetical protein
MVLITSISRWAALIYALSPSRCVSVNWLPLNGRRECSEREMWTEGHHVHTPTDYEAMAMHV